ncbi:hypothetical protein GW17_00027004 [Ensete ventricosum]|nr:hypothetical protein GW17_00027004 [Ensete ventricosum]
MPCGNTFVSTLPTRVVREARAPVFRHRSLKSPLTLPSPSPLSADRHQRGGMMAKERLVGVAAGHGAARLMGTVGKAASRAAVHGSRPPATQSVDVSMHIQEAEEDINKGKEEKQRKQQEIENEVDSEIKNPRGQRSS